MATASMCASLRTRRRLSWVSRATVRAEQYRMGQSALVDSPGGASPGPAVLQAGRSRTTCEHRCLRLLPARQPGFRPYRAWNRSSSPGMHLPIQAQRQSPHGVSTVTDEPCRRHWLRPSRRETRHSKAVPGQMGPCCWEAAPTGIASAQSIKAVRASHHRMSRQRREAPLCRRGSSSFPRNWISAES